MRINPCAAALIAGFLGGCNLSPESVMGGSEPRPQPGVELPELAPASPRVAPLDPCDERPRLFSISEHLCTSSAFKTFWELFAPDLQVEASPDASKLYVRLKYRDLTSVTAMPEIYRLSFRNTANGDIWNFTCTHEVADVYACLPQCRLSAAKASSTDPNDCVAIPSGGKLAKNLHGQGQLAIYRYGLLNPRCTEEFAIFGDLRRETPSGYRYCDNLTHERGDGDLAVPSFDWSL